MSPSGSFEPGELIGGRYELGRQLGVGGMARVYLGHDRLLDREVAVKVLSEPYASDPQFVERFRREASAAAGLSHPNIVAVYDRGEADGSYYIVMEYLSGPDLKQVIRRRAPLPPAEAVDYAQQILAALGAAHRRDVIHRDVKPQNVMVAEDGHLKVTDFGIARAGARSDMTEAGAVIGTAQYLSPEQARGDDVTTASDCYAVGIVLYEMLTGRVPFDGERPVTVAMKQITDTPAPPRTIEPGIPPELEAVVTRALAKRPSERYRTAGELSRALDEAMAAAAAGGPTRVMPAAAEQPTAATRAMEPATAATRVGPPPSATPPPGRRRRWPLIAGLIVVLLALAVAGALLLGGDDAEPVTIPSVAGQTAAQAQAALEELNLEVTTENVESDVDEGLAIETVPRAGQTVDEGSTVTLRISGGPGQETVPGVVGKQEEEARAELGRAGFDVSATTEASEDEPEGVVIRQNPGGGEQADRESTVTIVVSSGPGQVSVPDVRRGSLDAAEVELRGAGLEVGNVSSRPNADFPPDTVIEQSPGPTASVDRGTRVDLVVAEALSTVPVPDVIGNTVSDAITKLENAGFTVTSDAAESDQPVDVVIDQDPDPGTQIERDQPVNVTVSLGPGVTPGDGGGDDDERGRGPDGRGPPGQR